MLTFEPYVRSGARSLVRYGRVCARALREVRCLNTGYFWISNVNSALSFCYLFGFRLDMSFFFSLLPI